MRRIFAAGKIASMCGMEGGHQINNSMGALRMMYALGVRYMTLTHNGGPGWADSALSLTGQHLEEAPAGGLTPFGLEIIKEMNRMGKLANRFFLICDVISFPQIKIEKHSVLWDLIFSSPSNSCMQGCWLISVMCIR